MEEPKVDVKPAEPVNPAPDAQPLPGQPSPAAPGVSPDPGVNEDGTSKVVPLAALHEERDRRQSLQAELDALKQIAGNNMLFDINGKPVSVAPTPQGVQQPQSDEFQKNLDKAWEDDPRQAVEMTIGAALQWRDDIDAKVDYQVADASTKFADFNDYHGDVRKYIRALPMNQRANPGVVDMAYFVVKGQKSGNVYSKAQADMLEKIRRGEVVSGLNPGMVSAPAVNKGVQLSQDQLNVASAMGMTPEQYKANMK